MTSKSRDGRLRIVAGNWRSRLLEIADVPGLRPTSERIRETLFNWLAPRIDGARCLDLFAGTGALGLEALSRGAKHCVFVEKSELAVQVLRDNARSLEAKGAEIIHGDARSYLRDLTDEWFDIVFLDPPFSTDLQGDFCEQLAVRPILSTDARVYIEESRVSEDTVLPSGWEYLKSKAAGNVRYSLVKAGYPTKGSES
ncbi:MAG: 16S rRNA (guanine(966)-N(2))-methyltransferase RsmD [Pseudomonadota bacterium]